MAKVQRAFADNAGKLHSSAEAATRADIIALLGNEGLASAVLSKRTELEALFAEHDQMTGAEK